MSLPPIANRAASLCESQPDMTGLKGNLISHSSSFVQNSVDSTHSNSWRELRLWEGSSNVAYIEYDPTFDWVRSCCGE